MSNFFFFSFVVGRDTKINHVSVLESETPSMFCMFVNGREFEILEGPDKGETITITDSELARNHVSMMLGLPEGDTLWTVAETENSSPDNELLSRVVSNFLEAAAQQHLSEPVLAAIQSTVA